MISQNLNQIMSNVEHYAPPPGSPPPSQPQPSSLPLQLPVDEEPPKDAPPPYTAKATDPLPPWSASSTRFEDLTHTEHTSDLARLPLDPPPDCFSSPTPLRIHSHSFEPFRIPSRGPSLQAGFYLLYAPDALPKHGISAKDWTRFLQDLGIAARLSAQGLNIRGAAPPPSAGFFRGNTGKAYEAAFVKTPIEEVQGLIDVWNQSALERRKVRVSLKPRLDANGRQREGYDLLVESL